MVKNVKSTIFALSTPEGKSGIAVIRISGEKCLFILEKLCHLKNIEPRVAKLTKFYNKRSEVIDQGLIIWFNSPLSYTGEDMLELHTHGSPAIIKKLMGILISIKNVRGAFPGEFSKRALINKKVGLSNLEGINNLINSETELELNIASNQAFGGLNKKFEEWKREFLELTSLIESQLEFSEDDSKVNETNIALKIKKLFNLLEVAITNSYEFSSMQKGVPIIIFGPPNTGKSSLFNLINDSDRSIVSKIRGTTRDIVDSTNDFKGIKVNLIDSAGLHETIDPLEKIGTEKSKKIIEASKNLILVLSPDKQSQKTIKFIEKFIKNTDKNLIVFYNKSDKKESMKQQDLWEKRLKDLKKFPFLKISCKEKVNKGKTYKDILNFTYKNLLKKKKIGFLYSPFTESRHRECLKKAKNHLIFALNNIDYLEIAAEEVRLSRVEFEKIVGNIDNEEQLDFIFSKFCIGK